ncbi:hypothetical protein MMC25_006021 [Agyrium rufum]|nr:hypothetical protein [Agyrium rufum]
MAPVTAPATQNRDAPTERSLSKQPLNVRTSLPATTRDSETSAAKQYRRRPSDQQPDFWTASVNNSYIPSPSPTKSARKPTFAPKPRQALGGGKSLSSGFRTTGESRPRRDPTSPTAASLRRQTATKAQSTPAKSTASATPATSRAAPKSAPAKESPPTERPRTPSPSPKRQETLISPSSSTSSPPWALADTYKRIEDEEDLAEQEGISDEDMSGPVGSVMEDIPEDGPYEPQSVRSGSPVSHKPPERIGTLDLTNSDNELQDPNHDRDTQHSDSVSIESSYAAPEDDTFDQRRSQYERDERRMRDVLRSDSQPFSKARLRERPGLTLENLQRKEPSSQSSSSPRGSLGSPSISSHGSEPSLNIPKEWGTKGRGENRWLRRLDRGSGKFTGDLPIARTLPDLKTPDEDQRRASEPIVDWISSTADMPRSSVEDQSQPDPTLSGPRASGRIHGLRPTTSQLSLSRINELETAADEAESPAKPRISTLKILREREIENLGRKTLTTNRLGELHKQKSLDYIRRRSPSVSSEPRNSRLSIHEETEPQDTRESQSPSKRSSIARLRDEARRQSVHSEIAIDDLTEEPVLVSNPDISKPEDEAAEDDTEAREDDARTTERAQRPTHDRQDSMDLLRRLARVSSASPSPSLTPRHHSKGRDQSSHSSADTDTKQKSEPEPTVDREPEPELAAGTQPRRLASSNHRSLDHAQPESTPHQSRSHLNMKTPKVTGAWVDTPLPPRSQPGARSSQSEDAPAQRNAISAEEDQNAYESTKAEQLPQAQDLPSLEATAPKLPSSALASIIEEQRARGTGGKNAQNWTSVKVPISPNKSDSDPEELGEITLQLGDSTLQSLEELVAQDTVNLDTRELPETKPEATKEILDGSAKSTWKSPEISPTSKPSHQVEQATRPPTSVNKSLEPQDLQSYNTLTSRLSRLGLSLRDAKKGIANLENAVAQAPLLKGSNPRKEIVLADGECIEGGEFHDFIWPCERCGCRGGSMLYESPQSDAGGQLWTWQIVRLPVPTLYQWKKGDVIPRFTKLGLATIIIGGMILGEVVARRYYVPPFYAYSMVGYGVDYTLPRPPFLFPKLLWREVPADVKSALVALAGGPWFVLCILVRILAGIFGFDAGIFAVDYDWELWDQQLLYPSGNLGLGRTRVRPGVRYTPVADEWGRPIGGGASMDADERLL